jgi:cobalamin biosynthesis protein CobD
MEIIPVGVIALVMGFTLDSIFGDPEKLPHPIVAFGNTISWFEKRLNKGSCLFLKGAFMTGFLVTSVYLFTFYCLKFTQNNSFISLIVNTIIIFYCLSGLTLRREVRMVFEALERSTAEGRQQLSRIVGRDTAQLEPQQIRKAALETLAENLSDGVIAPLFWFALLGAPGMLTYKMINTLDSMIGYKNERYLHFGKFAARLDDVANFIPARITALIMLLVAGKLSGIPFVLKYGKCHSSPNSGYPEAALASILNCRFGGPNSYFGKLVEKPFIGTNEREIASDDMKIATKVNQRSEFFMLAFVSICLLLTTL